VVHRMYMLGLLIGILRKVASRYIWSCGGGTRHKPSE
jgi:hypothetical protein